MNDEWGCSDGTVGSGTVTGMARTTTRFAARGRAIRITMVADSTPRRPAHSAAPAVAPCRAVITNPAIDVVVELIV